MKGGIVLNQGSDGGRQHFSVVSLPLSMGLVAIHTLGPTDDRSHRDVDSILCQAISQGRVVVTGNGQSLIFDQLFLPYQSLLNLCFHSSRQPGWRRSLVGRGKRLWIMTVFFEQGEEASLADTQCFLPDRSGLSQWFPDSIPGAIL